MTALDTSEKTLEAKEAFERFSASHRVTVTAYHANNGRFADNLFHDAVHISGHTITFCSVGAHHQNGKVEWCIHNITDYTQTMLLHATHCWPCAVNVHHVIYSGLYDLWFTSPGAAARHATTQPPLPPTVGPLPVSKGGASTVQDPKGAPTGAMGLTTPEEASPAPKEDVDDLQPPEIPPAQAQVNEQLAGDQEVGTIQLLEKTR